MAEKKTEMAEAMEAGSRAEDEKPLEELEVYSLDDWHGLDDTYDTPLGTMTGRKFKGALYGVAGASILDAKVEAYVRFCEEQMVDLCVTRYGIPEEAMWYGAEQTHEESKRKAYRILGLVDEKGSYTEKALEQIRRYAKAGGDDYVQAAEE